jgi:Stigma-specific protein, Stig1
VGLCCNGQCIDQSISVADPFNCGGCGTVCASGSVCSAIWWNWVRMVALSNFACVPLVDCTADRDQDPCALPSGDAGYCCAGRCVDIFSDSLACGFCGNACPDGGACVSGFCSAACSGDQDCPAGYGCSMGSCLFENCGGGDDGTTCFNPDTGGYGDCCGGVCSDLSDAQNCGGCGRACAQGEQCVGAQICYSLSCRFDDDYCLLDDGGVGSCCTGQCVDLKADPLNCWACGWACPTGALCHAPDDCETAAGVPVRCTVDSECPSGDRCTINGTCVPPTCADGGTTCYLLPDSGPAYGYCCGGECVNKLSDPLNCGGCGLACPFGAACVEGSCMASDGGYIVDCSAVNCPSGSICSGTASGNGCFSSTCNAGSEWNPCLFGPGPLVQGTCCGDSCVDLFADPKNCGSCGLVCTSGQCINRNCVDVPAQNCAVSCAPSTICVGAECVPSTCSRPNQLYCLAEDGTVGTCCAPACAHLDRDPENCGACGISCPAGMSCDGGFCGGLAECGAGHAGSVCNLDAGLSYLCCPGLGCIDTSADPANCGACGNACPSSQTCIAGSCS